MSENHNSIITSSWEPHKRWWSIFFNRQFINLLFVSLAVVLLLRVSQLLEVGLVKDALLFFCGSVWGAFFELWLKIVLDGSSAYTGAMRIKKEVDNLMMGHKSLWDTVRVSLESRDYTGEVYLDGVVSVLRMHKIQFEDVIFNYSLDLEELGFDAQQFLRERSDFFKDISDVIGELVENMRARTMNDSVDEARKQLSNGRGAPITLLHEATDNSLELNGAEASAPIGD